MGKIKRYNLWYNCERPGLVETHDNEGKWVKYKDVEYDIKVTELHDSVLEIATIAEGRYGADSQLDMVIEECSELITKISHYKRGRILARDMCEEVADVQIMLGFMKVFLGESHVNTQIEAKLKRLSERMRVL